jgi:hypothetical protein
MPAIVRFAMVLMLLGLAVVPVSAEEACADPRAHQFDFWVGDWEVFNTEGGRRVGTNRITAILDGCVLQERWRGVSGSAGSSLNFFDTERGHWRQFWVWREGTTLELEGEFREGRMILEGDSRARDGSPLRNRITWSANDDGTVRQLWEISGDGAKTWRTEFDGIYRKRVRAP